MITIIVNGGNFQPRVMTLPKSEFPSEMYNILLKYSNLNTENKRILLEKIVWSNNCGQTLENEWNHITNKIYQLVDWWEDDLYDRPEWCKNAKVDRDHGYFNSDLIDTQDNETFIVIQKNYIIDTQTGELILKNNHKMSFDTVEELKKSFYY